LLKSWHSRKFGFAPIKKTDEDDSFGGTDLKNLGKYLLLLIPIAIAIWALLPTYLYNSLEEEQEAALARAMEAETPADSLSIMESFYAENRDALDNYKNGRLKLGLDLRGGMYVTLEVDIVQMLEDMVYPEYRNEELFQQVLSSTREEAVTSEESVIDIFLRKFETIAKPEGRSLVSYFDVPDLSEVSDEKIIEQLRENEGDAIDQAQQVIRQRIDKYGVAEPNIQKAGNKRIIIELPGVKDEGQIKELLKATAKLEFKIVKSTQEDYAFLTAINDVLVNSNEILPTADDAVVEEIDQPVETLDEATEDIENPSDTLPIELASDTAATDTSSAVQDQPNTENIPFTRLLVPAGGNSIYVPVDSLGRFQEILRRPEVLDVIPLDTEILYGEVVGEGSQALVPIYIVNSEAELTGEVLTDAGKYFDPMENEWVVSMSMNDEGTDKWAQITRANVGNQIAIVLDDLVYSAPNVVNPITGGSSSISGAMTADDAKLLEIVLKAGSLKAPVNIIEERVVGASLGEDSIDAGITASFIAFILVVLFMALYYGKGGLVADFAVVLNVVLIITFLATIQGTLTLPGIAGIILTIGMAVDANVLIFERVREELARGRSVRAAIDEGYSKALSAILDSNITTFITALILYFQGSGVIQGFALTLIFGIFATLFTAILVTRAIVEISLNGPDSKFSFGQATK